MPCNNSSTDYGGSRYDSKVHIGNWYEDMCVEEVRAIRALQRCLFGIIKALESQQKINEFKKLRDRKELIVEKARTLFDNFFKEIALEAPKQTLVIGAVVQVMTHKLDICDMNTSDLNPALSIIINERVVNTSQTINESCDLTVAISNRPCVRNSFRIVSSDENHCGQDNLKYGQHFRMQCVEPVDNPIWLYSAPKLCNLEMSVQSSFESQRFGEINLPLGLIHSNKCGPGHAVPAAFANWFCVHVDPEKRFETEGHDVPSNSPLIIKHVATNKSLACENVVTQTLFGPEFLVSVQNYRNNSKRETWKNIWIISNGHLK